MYKFIVFCLCLLCISPFVHAENLPDEITINGVTHYKASTSSNNPNKFIDYIPKGETLESWSSLVGIYQFVYVEDAHLFAKNIEEKIGLQGSGKHISIELVDDTPSHLLQTYVLWGPVKSRYVTEQNLWRYQKKVNGNGIMAIQYATRQYSDKSVDEQNVLAQPFPAIIVEQLKALPIQSYQF